MKPIFFIFLIIASFLFLRVNQCFGQLEGANWYFGTYAGLDFNTDPPTQVNDGMINTYEGCSSISDKAGNLLFYTDGKTVYDKNHNIMLNGSGLHGHSSSVQSLIVCPKPGTWNEELGRYDGYIIGTLDYENGSNGVGWSEVNILANNGLGEVVAATKNTHLYGTNTVEGANFARHANGCDFWYITKEVGNSTWRVYPVTEQGVINTPVYSTAGSVPINTWGTVKTSSDSKTIAFSNRPMGVQIFDFNKETGAITHRYGHNTFGDGYYSLEFAPNDRFLYFTRLEDPNVYQLDLNSTTEAEFVNSLEVVGSTSNGSHFYKVGSLQIAPNEKIYLTLIGSEYLGVIEYPDLQGSEAHYVDNAVFIGGYTWYGEAMVAKLGLPSFPKFLFKDPPYILAEQICFTQDAKIGLSHYDDVQNLEWYVTPSGANYSGTPTSTEDEFFLYDMDLGVYEIMCVLEYQCSVDSIFRTLKIIPYDSLELGDDLCYYPGLTLNAGNQYDVYQWQNASNEVVSNQASFTVEESGIYTCRVGVVGEDLIYNGDFELGNVGFVSDYVYDSYGVISPGKYYVGASASTDWWEPCSDVGKMLIVDAYCEGQLPSNLIVDNFWNQKVYVTPNTDYYFSAFIRNANSTFFEPVGIALKINGEEVTTKYTSETPCQWDEITFVWNSGDHTSVILALTELSGECFGMDFAVDNISFRNVCFDESQIEVFDAPTAEFTVSSNCIDSDIEFVNSSTYPNDEEGQQFWDFYNDVIIDATDNEVSSPFLNAGSYDVTLIAESENGCRDTITEQVNIYPSPKADFEVSLGCVDELTVFTNTSNGNGDEIDDYSWDFGNNETSTEENPEVSYSDDNTYSVQLIIITEHGCSDTIVKDVSVYPTPNVDFSATEVCLGDATSFTDLSSFTIDSENDTIVEWNWDFDDEFTNTNQHPNHIYQSDGTYNVVLTLTTNHGCESSTTIPVSVFALPVASFVGNSAVGCSPVCITVNSTSVVNPPSAIEEYVWTLGNQVLSYENNSFKHCMENNSSTTQSYDLHLLVTTDKGCSDEVFQEDFITVYPNPVAAFTYSPHNPDPYNPVVNFHNNSTNATSYYWEVTGTEEFQSNETNPTFIFLGEAGEQAYHVMLVASNEYNCTDTAFVSVIVEDLVVFYVPNAFTPDGDEHNNMFLPVITSGIDIFSFKMTIFNRWGELIFETYDHKVGWDGTYGGLPVQDGTYIWKIEFIEKSTDMSYSETGHVIVIR